MNWTDMVLVVCIGVSSGFVIECISQTLKGKRIDGIAKLEKTIEQRLGVDINAMTQVTLSKEDDSKVTLLRLTDEIERRLQKASRSLSLRSTDPSKIMSELMKKGIADSVLVDGFRNVWDVRNRVIHRHHVDKDEISMAMHLAAVLLSALCTLKQTNDCG